MLIKFNTYCLLIIRHLSKLKGYIRNNAKPEGSIEEGYLMDECMTFCSQYSHEIETILNRPKRNDDRGSSSSGPYRLWIFPTPGRHLGKAGLCELNDDLWSAATLHVLQNCNEAEPFVR